MITHAFSLENSMPSATNSRQRHKKSMCVILTVQIGTDSYRWVISSLNCTCRQLFNAALISNARLIKAVGDVLPVLERAFCRGMLSVSS